MQSIWTFILILIGFIAFNFAPSNVADALTSYQFRELYPGYRYYRSAYFSTVSYTKYRYAIMNKQKMSYRAYSYTYDFGEAALYHKAYSYVARLRGYRTQTSYLSKRQCGNFETNIYGDFIGFFKCPLFFEPRNLTYCCEKKKSHYCCSQSAKSTPFTKDPGSEVTKKDFPISGSIGIAFAIAVVIMGALYCVRICIGGSASPGQPPILLSRSRTSITSVSSRSLSSTPRATIPMPQPGQPLTTAPGTHSSPPYPQQLHPEPMVSMSAAPPPSYDSCVAASAPPPAIDAV